MRVLAALPVREIEGADFVLPGFVAECASGNRVRVWPAITRDETADQTRIGFLAEWRREPTPDDLAELIAYTNEITGTTPTTISETIGDPGADPQQSEWLRTGKLPKGKRAN